jgi:hypothetical protein
MYAVRQILVQIRNIKHDENLSSRRDELFHSDGRKDKNDDANQRLLQLHCEPAQRVCLETQSIDKYETVYVSKTVSSKGMYFPNVPEKSRGLYSPCNDTKWPLA